MKDSCEVIEERGMLSGLGVGDGTKPAPSNQYGEKHTQELSVGILWSFKNLHLLHIWMQRSVAFQVRKNRLCVVQSDFQWDRTFTFVLATFLGCAMAESSPRVNLPPLLHPTGPPVVIFDVASQSPALSWLRWAAPYRNVNKHRHWGNRAPAGILTPGHRFSSEFIAS